MFLFIGSFNMTIAAIMAMMIMIMRTRMKHEEGIHAKEAINQSSK